MRKARVLIVDDSTVVRRLVSDALASDPALEIVGTAPNGKIALAKIPQVNPDIITLDIEMPELDGLATLAELRKSYPKLPVIMFSTLTQRGAVATLNALSLGASDYVTKPANVGSVTAAIQSVRQELVPKIKGLCSWLTRLDPPVAKPSLPGTRALLPVVAPSVKEPIELVAIGVSTGGPNALTEIFQQFPANFPVPIVIVQHMPPIFTKYLAERLAAVSPLEVREAQAGELLFPGGAWLAPGDFHMGLAPVARGLAIKLHQAPPENSCRPAVDALFRSVAETVGRRGLGVVLTGMGQDGLRGCEALRQAGGRVLAQDEATSVVWGMPGAVVGAGLADAVLPLGRIVPELVRLVKQHRAAGTLAGATG